MQPVTVSVPASARARSSASAVAERGRELDRALGERLGAMAGEQHDGLDLATHAQRQ
jgi:hypothetical protein